MLFGTPRVVPSAPYVLPDPAGMSILLVAPWLVLGLLPLLRRGRGRARAMAVGCWLASAAVAVPHLLYVNSGWMQFGYRFSLDWMPFMLLAAILGARSARRWVTVPPLLLAVAANFWGVLAVMNWESWSALLR
jgi:hypothetical protein